MVNVFSRNNVPDLQLCIQNVRSPLYPVLPPCSLSPCSQRGGNQGTQILFLPLPPTRVDPAHCCWVQSPDNSPTLGLIQHGYLISFYKLCFLVICEKHKLFFTIAKRCPAVISPFSGYSSAIILYTRFFAK
jgi:hypothetical protein